MKGISACVCEVDEAQITLEVNKIDGFSKLHNVLFEEKGIRVRRWCGIGRGKEISFDQLVLKGQGDTGIVVFFFSSLFMMYVFINAQIL